VDAIYLDFHKAFDKVPPYHVRLLDKIKAHGITGKILSWLANWVSGRQQRVVLNGNVSVVIGSESCTTGFDFGTVVVFNDIDARMLVNH